MHHHSFDPPFFFTRITVFSLRSFVAAVALVLAFVGLTPAQAQPYTSFFVQGGRVSLTSNHELSLDGFRVGDDETAPDVSNGGYSIRAGFRWAQSRSVAMRFELGYMKHGPRSVDDIVADLRPEPGLELLDSRAGSESGDATDILLQYGLQYAPEWSRVNIVQPYAIVGVGLQISNQEDYYVEARFENPDSPLLDLTREVFSNAPDGRTWGLNGQAGFGLDVLVHSKYSVFAEVRGLYLYQEKNDLTNLTPYFGINVALNVDSELGRF